MWGVGCRETSCYFPYLCRESESPTGTEVSGFPPHPTPHTPHPTPHTLGRLSCPEGEILFGNP
ncbi:MAG: hypothetical protein F6J93_40475 [Oscillatoria sp. SIO1A7]|nr:hypothetical protein [Oscillatoria sp. SIO1A7]